MKNLYNDLFCKPTSIQQNKQNQSDMLSPQKNKNVRIWGDFDYEFRFRTQGESLYQTSILYAEAEGQRGLPIPIKCKWYRFKNERAYQIEEINSNVYQLSAEDIGCIIRVEATPLDVEEFHGQAYGEFGPIELDPSARQTLEYVIGTGGSQFPVTVLLGGSKINMKQVQNYDDDYDSQTIDANLFVNSHVIKICFNDSFGGTSNDDAIALKYTIDYPKIELHPYDTQKFKIYYSDDKVEAKYEFNKSIEMKALSRQSRDLIALAIKCFSAHTYFINSKIISNVIYINFQLTSIQLNKDEKQDKQQNQSLETTISSVLLELEFVKRELYNQINFAKELESEKLKLKNDIQKMEDEMSVTIESYKSIIESFTQNDQTDIVKIRKEMIVMSKQIEDLERERQKLNDQKIVQEDERKQLKVKIEEYQRIEANLREEIELVSNSMGVPKQEVERMKQQIERKEKEVIELQKSLILLENNMKECKKNETTANQKLEDVIKEKQQIQSYLHTKEDEVAQLRQEVKQYKEEEEMLKHKQQNFDQNKVNELEKKIKELKDENESLIVQRKTLTKSKESVSKDLEKTKREYEQQKQEFTQNLERLRKANERLIEQQSLLENEKEDINNQKQQLQQRLEYQEQSIEEIKIHYEEQLKQLAGGKKKKKEGFLAMFDDEDSDVEKQEQEVQTESYSYSQQNMSTQTDKEKESKPQKKLEKSASKENSTQKNKTVSLDLGANKSKGVDQQLYDKKCKEVEEMKSKLEKLDSDLANHRYERNQDKQSTGKQLQELQMQNQMLIIEKQEKDGCVMRLKQLINDRDVQIENLVKEIERLSMRLCTAEGKLFELENN